MQQTYLLTRYCNNDEERTARHCLQKTRQIQLLFIYYSAIKNVNLQTQTLLLWVTRLLRLKSIPSLIKNVED